MFDAQKFVEATRMSESDRFLCFLPLFHVNAQVVILLSPLYCGGAAPMPVEVFERFEKKLNAYILEGYGLSEGTCVSSINPPPPQKRKIGSIGLALKGQDMKILDSEGKELPRGETGEIAIKGDNVMKGYWNNSSATSQTIRNGRLYTGDLGYQDQDGFFFIVGRSKEMIIRGGKNISSLPKTATGKIQKLKLKKEILEREGLQ